MRVVRVNVPCERLLQTLAQLACIHLSGRPILQIVLDGILGHLAVLFGEVVLATLSIDAIAKLLNRVLATAELCLENSVDEHTLLEVVFLLEHRVCRLKVVIATDPILLILLEDRSGVGYGH